ncbi:MAG: hypothetical protein MZV70_60680 [Desulfobacterales bacterium]|nr:hypothetical protein [Desulfobacterales bacterium]
MKDIVITTTFLDEPIRAAARDGSTAARDRNAGGRRHRPARGGSTQASIGGSKPVLASGDIRLSAPEDIALDLTVTAEIRRLERDSNASPTASPGAGTADSRPVQGPHRPARWSAFIIDRYALHPFMRGGRAHARRHDVRRSSGPVSAA